MKKVPIFLIVLVFHCLPVFTQNIYYDAIELSELLQSGNQIAESKKSLTILGKYTHPETHDKVDWADIRTAFIRNPFIKEDGDIIKLIRTVDPQKREAETTPNRSSVFKSLGGLDVTTFAFALADFLVDRFKKEMSASFMDDFKAFLERPEFKDVQTLFPKTFLLAQNFDFQNYAGFVESLRTAFDSDFKTIYSRIPKIVQNHPEVFSSPKEYELFYTALNITSSVLNHVHPGDIIHDLAFNSNLGNLFTDFSQTVKTIDIFSQAIRSKEVDQYWVPRNDLGLIYSNKETFAIFLGLIYQYSEINPEIEQEYLFLRELLKKGAEASIDFKPYVQGILERVTHVQVVLNGIQNKSREEQNYLDYYQFITGVVDIMEFATDSFHLSNIGMQLPAEINKEISKILHITNLIGNIYLDANTKDYHSIVIDVGELLKAIIPTSPEKDSYIQKFLTYGTFMATVVKSKSTQEVEAAIEAIALPVGSSRIKRTARTSVDLNAYVGLFGAGEWVSGIKENGSFDKYKGKFAFGISAPIGLAFSSSNKDKARATSHSLFLSVLDIGALAAFRFGDSTTTSLPTIKLENIFAPGLYYVAGAKNSPFSFGVGAQFGPFLREITVNNVGNLDTRKNPNFRIGAFFAIDIPLLNFKAKPKRTGAKATTNNNGSGN